MEYLNGKLADIENEDFPDSINNSLLETYKILPIVRIP